MPSPPQYMLAPPSWTSPVRTPGHRQTRTVTGPNRTTFIHTTARNDLISCTLVRRDEP